MTSRIPDEKTQHESSRGGVKSTLLNAARESLSELSLHRRRHSVRGKLTGVVLLTTAIVLLVAGTGMLVYDLSVYRQSWASDMAAEAGILALSVTPALAFDDQDMATRNLEALRARPAVRVAALYDARGELYASYVQAGARPAPARRPALRGGMEISVENVEVSANVVQGSEPLGTVYLRARYDVMGRVAAYLGIFALVTVLSMGLALFSSAMLRRVITGPLEIMANVARQVVDRRDFSLRAQKTTEDEIGVVIEAFNSMLDEVQSRTRALEQSNAALHASEKLYRAIGESINYGVWVCDATGRNIYASESFLRLAGITQEQCSNFGWGELLHPNEAQATIAAWRECVQAGGVWYREHRFRGVDGQYHSMLAQGVPIKDENGAITGWAGINLDIGRIKDTEEALREADRRKDEFLATLAHELRNPLAPIRHAVKLLEISGIDERQRQWGREIIARQVQRMALLLDDLLDVSRITRGRLELKKDYVGLASVVGTAVETARPLIETKQHVLQVRLPPEEIQLEVDPLRLSQALSNLLTNAAKYTDIGGHIDVIADVTGRSLTITVRDTGIGLSPAVIPKLFEMFSQVDSAIDRAEGGLGIGLALVKGLVGLHGGTVEAASPGLGRGSEFTIRIPHAVATEREAVDTGQTLDVIAAAGPRCKVLLADDNRDAVESLALILQLNGYETFVTYSGEQALEAGARHRPDIAILDIGMPGMNGYEVAHRIRQEAWGRHALLLAVTGWGQEDDKLRAQSAGFDHHLTKPMDVDQLERLIGAFLAERQASVAGKIKAAE